MRPLKARSAQQGIMLIEGIIGMLIFLIGVLAMLGLQASAIAVQTDAQYRIEASKQVDRLLGEINVTVDRSSSAALLASLQQFQHQAAGTACSYSGAASAQTAVTNWVTALTSTATTRLPGSTAAMQQVLVAGNFNQVTITVCWQAPNDTVPRRHTVVSYVN
jgi:type IV pilus assembly protein PilV